MAISIPELAKRYQQDVHAASLASIDGEEEAQLTVPVSNLFCGLMEASGIGQLRLIRETRLEGSRPDFAALLIRNGKSLQKGHVELKAPSVPVDTGKWSGRNARQWQKMAAEAEILIVCNGQEAQLYKDGEAVGTPATLPYSNA